VLVLGNGENLGLVEAAEGEAILERDHDAASSRCVGPVRIDATPGPEPALIGRNSS
jgi:hypothetical protein